MNKKKTDKTEKEIFQQIKKKAFKLWDKAQRPKGRDWEFWFQAEKEIRK